MPTESLAQGPIERHGKARAFLRINLVPYALHRVRRNHWCLTKPDGFTTYHVCICPDKRRVCTCPDHRERGSRCKHMRALEATGLLPRPRKGKVVAHG